MYPMEVEGVIKYLLGWYTAHSHDKLHLLATMMIDDHEQLIMKQHSFFIGLLHTHAYTRLCLHSCKHEVNHARAGACCTRTPQTDACICNSTLTVNFRCRSSADEDKSEC